MIPIKVAIIGCGGRGREHAKGYAAWPEAQIVAVADPVPEAARTVAETYGVKATYQDYNQMLAEQKPDMVSICTWTGQHHQQVLDAVAAGVRAIHAEKPMAPTWGEAKAMHEAAEKAGVQLTFCHQRRFAAPFAKARELAQSGAIGTLLRLEGFCSNLFDWGTHWFDMFFFYNNETPATWVMGQIDLAEARTVFGAWVESGGLSYIRFANGVYGLLATGKEHGGGDFSNRIMGSDGLIEVREGREPRVRILRGGGSGWETPSLEAVVPAGGDTVLSVLDAIECLDTGREPLLSSRKALQATELIFATYESARRRARVTLPLDIEDSPLLDMLAQRGQKTER
ncbi:MAG: Gfo/Idh/MocA family oxidoreductase [Armatimonadota bacterium]|nr:Gfo/Idh/MocA family oxidoreductase [Armatimonadota bacterium]